MRRQQTKITVLLREDEFARFERYCSSQGFKKSTLIARLIREHLDAAGVARADADDMAAAEARQQPSPAHGGTRP